MAKFDSVESVKAKYEAGERVFTSHEVMVLLTRISHLENAAQPPRAADGATHVHVFGNGKSRCECGVHFLQVPPRR